MIKSFKQSWLEIFWNTGKHKKVPTELKDRLIRKLDMMNSTHEIKDMASPPSNYINQLHGDQEGQWAISVSGAWRLCFIYKDGDIYDIELIQYH